MLCHAVHHDVDEMELMVEQKRIMIEILRNVTTYTARAIS